MAGLAGIALGTAPIAGGALLGMVSGQFRSPNIRGLIKQDQDLLDRIPVEQTFRRAELQRTIDVRIDELVADTDRNRALREAAGAYKGNWRDVVLVLCVVLFTVVWWNVSHSRTNWLLTFIVLTLLPVVPAAYALRGVTSSLSTTMHRYARHHPGQ